MAHLDNMTDERISELLEELVAIQSENTLQLECIDRMQREYEEQKEYISGLKHEFEVQATLLKKAVSDYKTAKGWVVARDERIAALGEQIKQLQQDNGDQQKKLNKAVSDYSVAIDWVKARDERIKQLGDQFQQEKANHQGKLDKLTSDYKAAINWVNVRDGRITELGEQIKQLRQEKANQQEKLIESITDYKMTKNLLKSREEDIAVLHGQVTGLQEEKIELTKKVVQLVADYEETERRLTSLMDKLALSEKEIAQLKQGNAAQQALLKKAKEDYETAKGWTQARDEKISLLTKELQQVRQERDVFKCRYKVLSEAKLGRLTLWYWQRKDAFLYQFRKGDPNAKTIRNALKKIPGLQPLVIWARTLRQPKEHAQQVLPKQELTTMSPANLAPSKPKGPLPTITVVIPTYKKHDYLDPCVNSVLNQDYPAEKIDVILSVNGKDAAYAQWLTRKYAKTKQVKVIYTEVPGASSGRNFAKQFIRGEYVTYLDDDDYFTSGYLKEMAQYASPDVSMVCGRMIDLHDNGTIDENTYINKAMEKAGKGLHQEYLPLGSLLSSPCAKLYKSSIVLNVWGDFDESLKHTEDVVFWVEKYAQTN